MTNAFNDEEYSGIADPMGLRYTEFISWNTHMIQKLYKEIDYLKSEISQYKSILLKEV